MNIKIDMTGNGNISLEDTPTLYHFPMQKNEINYHVIWNITITRKRNILRHSTKYNNKRLEKKCRHILKTWK